MNRNSIHNQSNNGPVLCSLRTIIKLIENDPRNPSILPMELYDPIYSNTTVQIEIVLINKRYCNVRRVYMSNNKYRIGWIVDWDVQACMNCNKDFGWIYGRFKHHCRACGNLICHDCSPYLSHIAGIDELKGSRVCVNCFGIKPGTSPKLDHSKLNQIQNISNKSENINHIGLSDKTTSSNSIKSLSIKSDEVDDDILLRGSIRRKKLSHGIGGSGGSGSINNNNTSSNSISNNGLSPHSTATITSAMGGIPVDFDKQIEEFEREQLPLYERDYRKMREFIPVDIHKSNLKQLIKQGLPPAIAIRIWGIKILWLICMHKDDIYKIHLADFRSKYVPDGLDIVEMRAIWFNLPHWDEHSTNPLESGKVEWRAGFKSKLDNQLYKLHSGILSPQLQRHPAYQDYELLHLLDPNLPLKTRFDRSASSKQYAIESPFDMKQQQHGEDSYNNPERTQQLPYEFPKEPGTVQGKKTNYLNNFNQNDNNDYYYGHLNSLAHNDVYNSNNSNKNLKSTSNNNNNTDVISPQARLIDEINAEDDEDSYSFIHEDTFIDNKVNSYDDESSNDNNKSNKSNNNQSSVIKEHNTTNNNNNYNNKAPTPSNYSLGGDSQSTVTCNSISAGRKINSFRYRSAVSPKYQNEISSDLSKLKMEDKLILNNLINRDKIAEKQQQQSTMKYTTNDHYVEYDNNNNNNKITNHKKKVLAIDKNKPMKSNQNNSNTTGNKSYSQKFSTYKDHIPSSSSNKSTSYVNNASNRIQINTPEQQSQSIITTTTHISSGGGGMSGISTPSEQHSESTTSSLSSVEVIHEQVTNYRVNFTNTTVANTIHNPTLHTTIATTATAIHANHHHGQQQQQQHDEDEDDELSYNTAADDDIDITATLAEHVSTITSAHFAAIHSDADITSCSIPSNSSMPGDGGGMGGSQIHQGTTVSFDNHSGGSHHHHVNTTTQSIGIPAASIISNRSTSADESLGGATTPTGSAASSSIYRNKAVDKEQVKACLLQGNAANALIILRNYSSSSRHNNLLMNRVEASELMMQLLKAHSENITIDVIRVLLDVLHADINYLDRETGKSPLYYAVELNNSELGTLFVVRGADIFVEDHITATSPLVLSLTYQNHWLLEAYEDSGMQAKLLESKNHDLMFRLTTSLIYAGYSKHVLRILASNKVLISPEEATELLLSCQGNFESMQDPIETFELLESLGAII